MLSDISITFTKNKLRKKSQWGEILRRFIKNRTAVLGFVIVVIFFFLALFPQLVTSHDPIKLVLNERLIPPGIKYFFGTDEYGRDVFTRVVYGSRTSLEIGLTSVLISAVVGILVGGIAGYYGGNIDNLLMRLVDILMAIPVVLLGISIISALGRSIPNIIMAIAIGTTTPYARLVRVSVLSIRDKEYVEAARSNGASDLRIFTLYILPNCFGPIIVQATMSIAASILIASSLSFLGLGVPVPTPEWGSMLSSSINYMRDNWWLVAFPGMAIMASVFAFNLFGDGLRDALDPKLKN